ncbi:MAG: hypothetical protein K2H28_10575, partial [Ruminococcus sp.]|nr:hypothetical protein [Ruminococcus sp.]
VKESDDFEDFLKKCRLHNIEVAYNPEHVIDLKFRLDGQKNSPVRELSAGTMKANRLPEE